MSTDRRAATAEIMGTVVSIAAPAEIDAKVFAVAVERAFAHLRHADEVFSTYRPESPISQIRDGRLELDQLREHPDGESIRAALALCAQLKRESDGAFDAWAVGEGTGTGAGESAFDPSGLVKGWAAEQASVLLTESGVPSHSLGAGGDIQVRGGRGPVPGAKHGGEHGGKRAGGSSGSTARRPWRIGVGDPHRPGRLLTVVELVEGAVATSGTAERGAHIWDPRTGVPATALASVTIVGPNLTWADGYATAAHALAGADSAGPARTYAWLHALAARTGYQGLVVTKDTDVWWTDGFLEFAPDLHAAAKQ